MSKQVSFDIEMTDYNEATDETRVRISTCGLEDGNANETLGFATIGFSETGDIRIASEFEDRPDNNSRTPEEQVQFTYAVRDAVKAELDQHQSGPNGDSIETLRDLFAVVTPSGTWKQEPVTA